MSAAARVKLPVCATATKVDRCCRFSIDVGSNDGVSRVAVADANGLGDGEDEDLAVADFAGSRRLRERGDDFVDTLREDEEFEFDPGDEIDVIFGSAIHFGVAFLPAMAADFRDGDALDSDGDEGVFDIGEAEGLDDGFDLLHTALVWPESG
jgi:hypothetical protein